jgi:hypothetical protein
MAQGASGACRSRLLATTGLGRVAGFQEPVLLRLLAEATGARPGDAKLGRHGADGDAVAEQGGGLFETARLQVARPPGEPAPVRRGREPRLERPPSVTEVGVLFSTWTSNLAPCCGS